MIQLQFHGPARRRSATTKHFDPQASPRSETSGSTSSRLRPNRLRGEPVPGKPAGPAQPRLRPTIANGGGPAGRTARSNRRAPHRRAAQSLIHGPDFVLGRSHPDDDQLREFNPGQNRGQRIKFPPALDDDHRPAVASRLAGRSQSQGSCPEPGPAASHSTQAPASQAVFVEGSLSRSAQPVERTAERLASLARFPSAVAGCATGRRSGGVRGWP